MKGASFPKFALNADFPLVRFHGQSAKSETDAGGILPLAAAVRLAKFFEDSLVLIRRYALPIIGYGNRHIRLVRLDGYENAAIRFGKFDGIADQIFEHAANHVAVAKHANRIGWQVALHPSMVQDRRKLSGCITPNFRDIVHL